MEDAPPQGHTIECLPWRNRNSSGGPSEPRLFLGFGLIVGVWLFAGYYFTRRIADVEQQAAAINARYMQAQELLSTVRAQVCWGPSTCETRSWIPTRLRRVATVAALEDSYKSADQALQQYVPVLDSEAEREQVIGLRAKS